MTVVQVFNSDNTRSQFLAAVLQNVWLVYAIHKIELKVVHVAGITNVIADLLSRWNITCQPQEKVLQLLPSPVWYEITEGHLYIDMLI